MTVTVGAVREQLDGERRVALTPGACERLAAAGAAVRVERGAGLAAGFLDNAYEAAGAVVADDVAGSDVVACLHPPEPLDGLAAGSLLVGLLAPLSRPELAADLAARSIDSLALELVPRITRAQAMDALSSQATVAGYRAVLVAAERLPRFFPLLTTAAGTVRPARLLVLGAGVAGLQAIATGRRLGAVVSAFDVRQAAREQVESLGATFLAIELDEDAEGEGGYAKELSEEAHRREQELVARHVAESDVVITTALVPGRPAPSLVTASMVAAMRPGSVIVDLAAEAGGNCELTVPGETVVREGVTIAGSRLPAAGTPQDASELYARNVTALLALVIQDGRVTLDLEDPVIAGCCVTRGGEVVHPLLRGG
jgi:H+-translocating NAD(P) transhydrogenase subunit alpha